MSRDPDETADLGPRDVLGRLAGRFDLLDELGRGGGGVVYRARDIQTKRQVALKLLNDVSLDPEGLLRFQREGEIAARLDHPGIVKVHSAGQVDRHPYLVYEIVKGAQTLGDALDSLDLEGRVDLVRQVAVALGHAHAAGVVHRDVKPANILVERDSPGVQPRARLTDFGMAQAQGFERLTQTGVSLGTPSHMAPEQFEARRDLIGPPTDVWALGVILYRALTGVLPFPGRTLGKLRLEIAAAKPVPVEEHAPLTPAALVVVCNRALQPNPKDRYLDAGAMADDLARALRGESLTERRVSGLAIAFATGVVAFSLAVFLSLPDSPVSAPRRVVQLTPSTSPAVTPKPTPRESPRRGPKVPLVIEQSGLEAACFAGRGRLLSGGVMGVTLWDLTSGEELRRWESSAAFAVAATAEGRWLGYTDGGRLRIVDGRTREVVSEPEAQAGQITILEFAPDGRSLAVGGLFPYVKILSVPDGRTLLELGPHGRPPQAVAFSPDSSQLVTACGTASLSNTTTNDNSLRLYALDSGRSVARHTLGSIRPTRVAFDPGGKHVVLGDISGHIILYSAGTLRPLGGFEGEGLSSVVTTFRRAHGGRIVGLAFSLDGQRLLSVSGGGRDRLQQVPNDLAVWEVATQKQVERYLAGPVMYRSLELSGDGVRAMVLRSDDGRVEVWPLEEMTVNAADAASAPNAPSRVLEHPGVEAAHYLGPDGGRVVSIAPDGEAILWDLSSGEQIRAWRAGPAAAIPVSPKGDRFAVYNSKRELRIKDPDGSTAFWLSEFVDPPAAMAFAPDGVFACSDRRLVRRFALQREVATIEAREDVLGIAFSGTGAELIVASGESSRESKPRNAVTVWEVETGALLVRHGLPVRPDSLAAGPDGTYAVGDRHGGLHLGRIGDPSLSRLESDPATLEWGDLENPLLGRGQAHATRIRGAVFSPDGARLYTVCGGGVVTNDVRVWDVAWKRLVNHALPIENRGYSSIDISPDGRRLLLTRREDGRIEEWPVEAIVRGGQ